MQYSTLATVFAGTFALAAVSASAQTLVDFGGDMVGANLQFQSEISNAQTEATLDRDFNGDGNKTGRVVFRALDLDTPWLANSGSYTGPSFYGGMTAWTATTSGGTFRMRASSVINDASGDYLRPVIDLGEHNGDRASAALVLFSVANGQFAAGDSLTHAQGSNAAFANVHRFVVRANNQFYLSQTSASGSLGTIDPSAVNWALYNVTHGSDNLLVPGSAGVSGELNFTVAGSSLSGIDFIGIVGVNSLSGSGTATTAPSIGTFTYTAVPEPGAYALLAGMLGLTCVMVRRRRS